LPMSKDKKKSKIKGWGRNDQGVGRVNEKGESAGSAIKSAEWGRAKEQKMEMGFTMNP